ncbi:hypothetical protein TanjilG_16949 [Lupinus angustifolius]|uniref:uncharacterized protein LOC109336152 n=1 Tax=Lupinus angustifolius TaxID=3871 RepID=UPI00090E32AC|nr:PREDICTED: uncharacterized protein LOC109336152 [Lupinus angustifolius]OIV90989.1 hypothetical protein TanjilG_16949 [Lupinus angustifolius]
MEGVTVSVCKGLKQYWVRRRYQRLNGSGRRTNVVELSSSRTRKGRLWRWKIKITTKIRINKIPSPKKFLAWFRDAYVRMMLGLANTRVMSMSSPASGLGGGALWGGGYGFVRGPPPKEYDEKLIIEIYKSLIMRQEQLVARDAARIASEIS